MNNQNTTIKIATLNCRGLRKQDSSTKRKQFIRYLRTLGYDILVIQETHADDQTIIDTFNQQFNSKSSLWTHDCGIISLNHNYTLQHISDGIDQGRYILASLHLTRDLEHSPTTPHIATILNIYGRSFAHSERSAFYSELLDTPIFKDTITNTTNTIFIMGDFFNYQYENQRLDGTFISAPVEWTDMLDDCFIDVFENDKHNTWHSGRNNAAILDYVLCSPNAHHLVTSASQQYLSPEWTDHELLGFYFQFQDMNDRGPGTWEANPFLARKLLIGSEERLAVVKTFLTPQQQWDWFKAEVKMFIKQYQFEDLNW
ncbi:hypothetical protein MBANPS3_008403 [Mucor bainieri]